MAQCWLHSIDSILGLISHMIGIEDYDLLSTIVEGEGCCCVPIINQHFWCLVICLRTANEQHTFGRGPAGVESSVLAQDVSFLPVATIECSMTIECNTRFFLSSATSTTGEEAYIGFGFDMFSKGIAHCAICFPTLGHFVLWYKTWFWQKKTWFHDKNWGSCNNFKIREKIACLEKREV